MRYEIEERYKIWNRNDLPFQTWHEEFDKFWPEHSKTSKIWTLMGWFWPRYTMFQLKKVQRSYTWLHSRLIHRKAGLCFHKLIWGIWHIFARSLESLQIGTLMASFCLKLKLHELKIYRRVMYHYNGEWCKNWRGIDLSV